jgi:prepilin-type N-terminal cleavage/methylation domain-containing protein
MKTKKPAFQQQGFSLLEMLMTVTILGLVVGAVFSQLNLVVQRQASERIKVDDMQEARDFVDQFFRDINQCGYPNIRQLNPASYSPGLTTQSTYSWANQYSFDSHVAMGLVKIADTEIHFEGDMNGDGNVQSVAYMVNGSGSCAKCLQRSQVQKVTGDPSDMTVQVPNWGTEVNDVVNTNPIFKYYDANGNLITTPQDITTQSGANNLAKVKTIKISLQIQNNTLVDIQTGLPIQTSFEGDVSLNNCSMATVAQAMSCQ